MSVNRVQTGELRAARAGRFAAGLSLVELLVSLTIGAMVLVTVLTIYGRAEKTASAVTRRLDGAQLPGEVHQRIAEDLDRMISPGSGTKITIANRLDGGFAAARIEITRSILDDKNKEQILEQIVWQSSYDVESSLPGLVLYRSHNGITLEDKLLDKNRTELEKLYPFVPICSGVTMFKIEVPQGDIFLDRWNSDTLPNGIRITLSFAEADKTSTGAFEVPEALQITRMIAADRTRKIKFEIASVGDANEQDVTDQAAGTGEQADVSGKAITDRNMNVSTRPQNTR